MSRTLPERDKARRKAGAWARKLEMMTDPAFNRFHCECVKGAFHELDPRDFGFGERDWNETLDLFDREYLRRFGDQEILKGISGGHETAYRLPSELKALVDRSMSTS